MGFFQATEPIAGYEVKSHVKLFAVDAAFAVTGGSNLYPTELTQKSDCDVAVNGAAARAIDDLFNEMWREQTGEKLETVTSRSETERAAAADELAPVPESSELGSDSNSEMDGMTDRDAELSDSMHQSRKSQSKQSDDSKSHYHFAAVQKTARKALAYEYVNKFLMKKLKKFQPSKKLLIT